MIILNMGLLVGRVGIAEEYKGFSYPLGSVFKVKNIADDAFSGCDDLIIFGNDGSYAEFYVGKYGFGFISIEE